jgi:hypothetical protein
MSVERRFLGLDQGSFMDPIATGVIPFSMGLIPLIPLAWAVVTAFVVAACQVASRADAELEPGSGAGELVR